MRSGRAGVRLEFGDGTAQTLRAVGNMARFDGGLATRGVLLQGPCADLNLIVARHGYRVRARVVELRGALAESPADGETALVVPLDAPLNVSCDAGEPFHLAPGDVAVGRYRGLASASPCRVFVAGITDNVP